MKTLPSKSAKKIAAFQVVENQCIWMKAGVVNYRICDNAYDCNHCAFDTGMRKAMGNAEAPEHARAKPPWVQMLKAEYRGAARPCRHYLTGRIAAPKLCPFDYECSHCAFDQMLDDADRLQELVAPAYLSASGYRLAEGYYYHPGHTWARFEHGGRVRVGFDDFGGRLFGKLSHIALPPLGQSLKQGRIGLSIRRQANQAAVLSPISGTVLQTNDQVVHNPRMVHTDPYRTGWLLMVEPDMPKRDLKGLYFGSESTAWIARESQKLLGLMGAEYEHAAATGGQPIGDVWGSFPEIGWDRLAQLFLHTQKA